jgi:hypothetical protein
VDESCHDVMNDAVKGPGEVLKWTDGDEAFAGLTEVVGDVEKCS